MRIFTTGNHIGLRNTAVTLGKFDGLHLGHRELVKQLILEQKKSGLLPVLFSFDTAQLQGLNSLTTCRERAYLCEQLGIEALILFPVNEQTMSMEAEQFIRDILVGELGAKIVVTGMDFRFGKDRLGSVDTLLQYSSRYGYSVITKNSRMYGNEKISSSRIKQAIGQGKLKEAEEMLGYHYFVIGNVVKGRQIGRTIGIRTLNVETGISKILPPKGVYGTRVLIDGKEYKSITNVGTCPTVTDNLSVTVETHVLDFAEEIYGSEVVVFFDFFIREEKKFDSLTELQKQINSDIDTVQNAVNQDCIYQ